MWSSGKIFRQQELFFSDRNYFGEHPIQSLCYLKYGVICVFLGWNFLRVKILQLCFFHLEPISSGTYIFTIPAGLNNVSRRFSFQLKSWHFFNLSYYWKLFWIFWQSCGMWLLNFLQNQTCLSSKISLSQIHFRYLIPIKLVLTICTVFVVTVHCRVCWYDKLDLMTNQPIWSDYLFQFQYLQKMMIIAFVTE